MLKTDLKNSSMIATGTRSLRALPTRLTHDKSLDVRLTGTRAVRVLIGTSSLSVTDYNSTLLSCNTNLNLGTLTV